MLGIAKGLGVPCVVEIRDLWPESFVAYYSLSYKHPLVLFLSLMEKSVYRRATAIVFTPAGGKAYVEEHKVLAPAALEKVRHINNGVDLEAFDNNVRTHTIDDDDLLNPSIFRVVYAGSVRLVNDLSFLVEVAERLSSTPHIRLLVYGDGDDRERLAEECRHRNLTNIVFKGPVSKNEVPFLMSRSDVNLLHSQSSSLLRYGVSPNKLFEYFAAGKPVLSDLICAYDLIPQYNAGLVVSQEAQEVAGAILRLSALPPEEYREYCQNARQAAEDYDFRVLTQKLLAVLEEAVSNHAETKTQSIL
jgi:glycosyltransferase involved in cell wall biosynthesis